MRIILPVIVLLGLLATGCISNPPGKARPPQASASPPPTARSGEAVDYSPEAIEHRTEAQARFAAGFLHDLNDEPEQAAAEYFKAGAADTSDEQMVLEASTHLLRLKQNDKALELLKMAAAEPGASALLFAQLGMVYSITGNKEKAIEADRLAITKQPRSIIGYRALAQVYLQEGLNEEGLKVLDQASAQPEVDANYLTELGELYLVFAKATTADSVKPRALEVFKRAAKAKPTHPVVLEKLADGFAVLGELDAAAGLYQTLLARFPTLSGLREKAAEVYLRKKDYPKAAEQYRFLVRLNPTNPQGYYFLGSIAYEETNLTAAADNFTKVMQLNSNFEPAYYDLASTYLRLDQPTNALATLEKARSKFKPNFVCEFYTGMAYYALKQFTNTIRYLIAAEVIARASDTNRLDHRFYFQLGAAYERNQQYEEAEKCFRKSLELSPDNSQALNYLGYMWADRGVNLDEARTLIEKAVKLEPDNAAYLDSLGWVLFRLKQPKEALPFLLKAIKYAKEQDATLQDHLGDVYFALHELEKAREAWSKSLTIDPNENKEQIKKKIESARPPPKTSAGASQRQK